jgi:hypothetical protein
LNLNLAIQVLFLPEREHRVDPSGAASRNPRRNDGDDEQRR